MGLEVAGSRLLLLQSLEEALSADVMPSQPGECRQDVDVGQPVAAFNFAGRSLIHVGVTSTASATGSLLDFVTVMVRDSPVLSAAVSWAMASV